MRVSGSVTADVRYSFTGQFLLASASQALDAFAIEDRPIGEISEQDRTRHRGLVVGAILQSVAALESEAWEVTEYGPGHHLGSNGTDAMARDVLRPISEMIDRLDILTRYETVLHLLRKREISRDGHVYENAMLLIKLRNEIVHYKSRWGSELERKKFFASLKSKGHRQPPFLPATGMNFFPHYCLSADCAAWASESSVGFLELFYQHLEVSPRLASFKERLKARPLV